MGSNDISFNGGAGINLPGEAFTSRLVKAGGSFNGGAGINLPGEVGEHSAIGHILASMEGQA